MQDRFDQTFGARNLDSLIDMLQDNQAVLQRSVNAVNFFIKKLHILLPQKKYKSTVKRNIFGGFLRPRMR